MSHRSVIVLLILAGCSRPPQPQVEAGARETSTVDSTVADTTVQGTVRVVGPLETAQVILRGPKASVGLTGPLAVELRRLSGATVRATGAPQANDVAFPPRAVSVREYQLLAVDGRPAVTGILLTQGDRFLLVGQDTIELVGVTSDLAGRLGAKLFVVGMREEGSLRIKSYGVIRDPK